MKADIYSRNIWNFMHNNILCIIIDDNLVKVKCLLSGALLYYVSQFNTHNCTWTVEGQNRPNPSTRVFYKGIAAGRPKKRPSTTGD